MIYLYALVDEESSGPLGEGVVGEPLQVIPQGGLAAVAGEIPERPRPDRETLERQDAVVRRLAERFGAILPARFGEAFADEAALAKRLAPREREVAAALALVRGCVQMTLRVFGEPEPHPEPEAIPAGGPGTRYLAARQREIERAHSLPEIEPLREALRPLLRAERIERRESAGPLLGTAYHLVLRGQSDAYLTALEAARERIGGRRVAATGPWPPYAFAPEAAP
jgi:Gas vesicle synthesis protein GvpL/GvpF